MGGLLHPALALPGCSPASGRAEGSVSSKVLLCSTAALAPPGPLGFSDVSHDSALVTWGDTPRPAHLFRVSYVSSDGGHSGQVRAGTSGLWVPRDSHSQCPRAQGSLSAPCSPCPGLSLGWWGTGSASPQPVECLLGSPGARQRHRRADAWRAVPWGHRRSWCEAQSGARAGGAWGRELSWAPLVNPVSSVWGSCGPSCRYWA